MEDDRPAGSSQTRPPPDDGDPFGPLPAGTLVGKYEIAAVLGQGGFGITYRARDSQLGRNVALKEYLPTSFAVRRGGISVQPRSTRTADDFLWGRERFLDEAKTLALLEETPGIVNVYDFLQANGTAYMVMALARGETLEARLKRDGRLPPTAIEQMLGLLLDGLEKVHAAGFLHRDIKPANILIDADNRPTLIDFGASRLALSGRTQAMTAIYTPGFAAFEQITGGKQGPWTDIYGLAATLYASIAGGPPQPAMERIAEDRLVPAAEAGKGRYARTLLAAIDAGLRLKPAERAQSVASWRRVLSGVSAESVGAPTREMDEPPTRRVPDAAGPGRRGRTLPWIAAGAVALALAAFGAWIALRPPPETIEQALRRAEDEARRQNELAARLRQEQEAEARRKADADAARRAAEEKAAAEAEARRQAEAETARKAAEEKAAAEAEARRQAEAEAARNVAEEKAAAEAEVRRQAEAETARKVAEEKAAAEAASRRQAEEAERQRAAVARQAKEEAARRQAEAERQAREEAERRGAADKGAAEAQARRQAEEEAQRRRDEEIRRETETRLRAEFEAQRRAEEAQRRAAAENADAARQQAEAEARRQAEQEAARREAEERARGELDARRQAEASEAALRLSLEDRKRVQVALTALGHNTQGSDGAFGPRTRAMITSWQKSQRLPETGHLTAAQHNALRQQAAAAIARFDEEQKKAEDDARRRAEEEARRRADAEANQRTPQPPQTAAAPPAEAAMIDGRWAGRLRCTALIGDEPITLVITKGQGSFRQNPTELSLSLRGDTIRVSLTSASDRGITVWGDLTGRLTGSSIEATGTVRQGSGSLTGPGDCTLRLMRQ